MNGTKTKAINEIQNKIIDNLINNSSFKNEKIISIVIAKIIKIKCLTKNNMNLYQAYPMLLMRLRLAKK